MEIPLLDIKDTGTVKEIKKGIVRVERLYSCINGQIVEIGTDLKGMVFGFNQRQWKTDEDGKSGYEHKHLLNLPSPSQINFR